MSGIYIPGMEMPTDHQLWIVVHADGTVEANEVSARRPVGWQTLRNAAVPVPPHGRLIDADAMIGRIEFEMRHYVVKDEFDKGRVAGWKNTIRAIREYAPTIIPAEGEEN